MCCLMLLVQLFYLCSCIPVNFTLFIMNVYNYVNIIIDYVLFVPIKLLQNKMEYLLKRFVFFYMIIINADYE